MTSTAETGHAKNVANLKLLISFCKGYGAKYNPSRDALKLAQLQELFTQATAAIKGVRDTKTDFDNVVNTRAKAFEELRPFATKLVNAFASYEVPAKAIADANGHNRKIQGRRATPKTKPNKTQDPAVEKKEDKTISVSQLSYDSLLENFEELVKTVVSQSTYTPNEAELNATGLAAKVAALTDGNQKVVDGFTGWYNARRVRNEILYKELTGLKDIAQSVKKYVLGIFNATSAEYKAISGIQFISIKI